MCQNMSTLTFLLILAYIESCNGGSEEKRLHAVLEKLDQMSRSEVCYLETIKKLERRILDKDKQIEKLGTFISTRLCRDKDHSKLRQTNQVLAEKVQNLHVQLIAANQRHGAAMGHTAKEKPFNSIDEYDDEVTSTYVVDERTSSNRPRKFYKPSLKRKRDGIQFPTIRSANHDDEPLNFPFLAVVEYNVDGSIKESIRSAAFGDTIALSEVLERIEIVGYRVWESKYEGDWLLNIATVCNTGKLHCISRMCENRRTTPWHPQFAGVYACKDCARLGRPCFVYIDGGLRLLPLHPDDRTNPAIDASKIKIWVNDEIMPEGTSTEIGQ